MKPIYRLLAFVSIFTAASTQAEVPAGYYDSCRGKCGDALLKALYAVINPHTTVSYSDLWTLYLTSDVDENGLIWDMYSTKRWTPSSEQCGTYSVIGDCYNREHSMPKSWFHDASPMYSDAFHIYPTDGRVNSQRSNFPYGECARGSSVASRGNIRALGKLGESTWSGYSGTVFEPDDEYKGDFARSYFYMAACYNDRIADWNSAMLAWNSYPVFTDWALNLLLKWHEMDPVSDKERNRNEAVAARQKNRNPFIDHPELVAHIWGADKTSAWAGEGGIEASLAINQPVNGSTFELGKMFCGKTKTATINLKTTSATEPVNLSVDAPGFAVSPAQVNAERANAGTSVEIVFTPAKTGAYRASLTISTGSARSLVSLTGTGTDRIPIEGPQNVSHDAFTVAWTYVGDDDNGNYTIAVETAAGLAVEGYPRAVDARAAQHRITDLDPATVYSVQLSSRSYQSDILLAQTSTPYPEIQFLFDGTLTFTAEPGTPSEAAEILVDTDWVEGNFTVCVEDPFEISLDKHSWARELTLTPDDSRLYLRLNSPRQGHYETTIEARYGIYVYDQSYVAGTVSSEADFLEDFEPCGLGTYSPQSYTGTACTWNLSDAGFWGADPANSGSQALRGGKSGSALVEMAQDRATGLGTLTFYARRFGTDANSVLAVEYSTDQGSTWTESGRIEITATTYAQYSHHVGVTGNARLRLRQCSGKRFYLDDLAITRATAALNDPEATRHQWDAYAHASTLTVEVKAATGVELGVYTIDGLTVFHGILPQGVHTFASKGFHIVADDSHSRTVMVK